MKLIIDIPEEIVAAIQNGEDYRYDIHTAIAQGIPYEERPQGDLISREALKKAVGILFKNGGCDSGLVMNTIDNAPTVEELSYDMGYAMGYQDGLEDGLQDIRPQGEWVKVKEYRMCIDMSGEIATLYKCSECGRTITILPSKLADYPFCHCGAAMQKGGAE